MARTLGEWLEIRVPSQCADAQAKNITDVDLLSGLDSEDMKDAGLSRLANRKRLLNAIAEPPARLVGKPRYDGSDMTSPKTAAQDAERRPDVPPSSLP